jgi:probable HAF family extracellular repeat protein
VTGQSYITGDTAAHAFRYDGTPGSGGVMHDLGTLGGTNSIGLAVNDAGQVVGWSFTGDAGFHAFLYTGTPGSGGIMRDLGTLGGTESVGTAVNNAGQVVGWSSTGAAGNHAFLYSGMPGVDGQMIDLDTWLDANNLTEGAKWTLTEANGISNTGWITGAGTYDPDGPGGIAAATRAYLLDASSLVVPEPSGLSLFTLAAPALMLRRRRHMVCAPTPMSFYLTADRINRSNPMTCFMQSKRLAVVAACFWVTTLAASPAMAQQPNSATINGTFIMSTTPLCCVGPDLAAIVAQGETHTWTLALHGLGYSNDDEIISSDPYDYYARSITRVYATSFDFQFQGPDADALNAIVSDRLENGGLQVEPFVELRNVTYYEPGWGAIFQARDWVIAIRPLDYLQGFRFESMPADLEHFPYTEDANGYPVLEPFTTGSHGASALITDFRPGYNGTVGTWGGNTVSVSSVGFSMPGDYNRDGAVDAADYVAWRKSPNNFGGDPDGYNTWRSNFGRTSGSGLAASENPVPEPGSLALLTLAVPALLRRRPPPAVWQVRLPK